MNSKLTLVSRRLRKTRNVVLYFLKGATSRGHCPICERWTIFMRRGKWLRDDLVCARCKSIPRWRALMQVLQETFPNWRELAMHESSPGGPLLRKFSLECRQYVPSQYYPDTPRGIVHQGFRCEDLMAQTFPDACFDLVITSDVFEHLPDGRSAMQEIVRTLKPGGAHIFTVPWYQKKPTLVRAVMEGSTLRHLEKPDYYHNPVDPEGSLVFTEWGSDFPALVTAWTGLPLTIYSIRDSFLGIDGEFREVFVLRKNGPTNSTIRLQPSTT